MQKIFLRERLEWSGGSMRSGCAQRERRSCSEHKKWGWV